jgi:DNA-directed RNA polymerase subunit alpha
MLEEIILPNLKVEEEDKCSGRFVISPLYPGYGATVGNALRRVLLSSLPGSAVTAIRITGADHEFSTIPGIKEDLVRIMMNMKGLRLRIEGGEETATMFLSKSSTGKVTAKDIKAPSQVTILNPDLPIATITGKTKFEMEIMAEKGRGYRPTEQVETKDLPIGTILLDAIFSPVLKVSYAVENTRVGGRVDYDQLTIEIETDGSITPKDALREAAATLIRQLEVFTGEMKTEVKEEVREEEKGIKPGIKPNEVSVEELNLSLRTTNALLRNRVKTLADVQKLGLDKLKDLKGLGAKAYNEILEKMKKLKLA